MNELLRSRDWFIAGIILFTVSHFLGEPTLYPIATILLITAVFLS